MILSLILAVNVSVADDSTSFRNDGFEAVSPEPEPPAPVVHTISRSPRPRERPPAPKPVAADPSVAVSGGREPVFTDTSAKDRSAACAGPAPAPHGRPRGRRQHTARPARHTGCRHAGAR